MMSVSIPKLIRSADISLGSWNDERILRTHIPCLPDARNIGSGKGRAGLGRGARRHRHASGLLADGVQHAGAPADLAQLRHARRAASRTAPRPVEHQPVQCRAADHGAGDGQIPALSLPAAGAAGAHGDVYEFRTYKLKPGGLPPTLAGWEAAIAPAREYTAHLVINMYALDGPPRITHI